MSVPVRKVVREDNPKAPHEVHLNVSHKELTADIKSLDHIKICTIPAPSWQRKAKEMGLKFVVGQQTKDMGIKQVNHLLVMEDEIELLDLLTRTGGRPPDPLVGHMIEALHLTSTQIDLSSKVGVENEGTSEEATRRIDV